MPTYQTEMTLQTSCEKVFEFLCRPANLPDLSQPDMPLTIVQAPEEIELGSQIQFAISVMGATIRAIHEITMFESQERFIEEQVEGPFKRWRHEHVFRPLGAEQVAVYDLIEYEPPGGVMGLLLNEKRIRSQLEEGFAFRQDELRYLLENSAS
jgi:ligand-binding SRPBCC domain-containing protein